MKDEVATVCKVSVAVLVLGRTLASTPSCKQRVSSRVHDVTFTVSSEAGQARVLLSGWRREGRRERMKNQLPLQVKPTNYKISRLGMQMEDKKVGNRKKEIKMSGRDGLERDGEIRMNEKRRKK